MKMGIPATGEEMKELNTELEGIEYVDLDASVNKSVLKTMPQNLLSTVVWPDITFFA